MTFTTQARSVREVTPGLPEPVVAVVDRALRLEKAQRWPSAAEMLIALRAAYETVFGEPMAPPIPAAPVSRRSLVSLHEVRSLTPVSSERTQRDSANTLPPPAMAVSQARKAPARGRLVAALASLALVCAIGFVAYRFAHESPQAQQQHQATAAATATITETPAVTATPPPPAVTAAIAKSPLRRRKLRRRPNRTRR